VLTVDKNAAYPPAIKALKKDKALPYHRQLLATEPDFLASPKSWEEPHVIDI